jgi:alpha-amylase
MSHNTTPLELISSNSMFKNLAPEEMQTILQTASERKTFKTGDILIHEGETNLLVYFIISGMVTVTRKDVQTKKIVHLATLEAKQVVGEISIITKKPKTATVTALTDTDALVIDFSKIKETENTRAIYTKLVANLADEMAKKLVYAAPRPPQEDEAAFDEEHTAIPNAIVVLMGWKWKDILYEIPFLAAHGLDAIKISPPQEFAVLPGRPWYEAYQPVSYELSNFYGSEEDFVAMIDTCHTFGVKVYADLLINHMAAFETTPGAENIGTNGHKFSKYKYGPLNSDKDYFDYDDFYHFGSEENRVIAMEDYASFDKAWRVEHFDLNYLPKLNFDNPHVISILRKYIHYLLYLGVDGFRIDAAKHISTDVLAKLLHGLKTKSGLNPFIYQEFYENTPMGIDPYSFMEKYFKLGYVTSFCYGEFLTDAITGRNNSLEKLVRYSFGSSWLNYPENRSITVIDNHDTERGREHNLSYHNSHRNAYVLAYIFMLTWPFGIPKIMSSFHFNDFKDGVPQTPVWRDGRNTCFDSGSPWVCQHRWQAISNAALFRKKVANAEGVTHVWSNYNQVAFARSYQRDKEYVAAAGFVVINNSSETLSRKFDTGLPAGEYANLVACEFSGGKMNGPTIKVEEYGVAEITVAPFDAAIICIDFAN